LGAGQGSGKIGYGRRAAIALTSPEQAGEENLPVTPFDQARRSLLGLPWPRPRWRNRPGRRDAGRWAQVIRDAGISVE
jgi:hypothetical protein